MKTILLFAFFIIIAFSTVHATEASEWESYELVDKLISLPGPGAPVIHENFVIFTADSNLRRVGIAFSHENFGNIYWFRRLLVPQDSRNPVLLPGEKVSSPYIDSGTQFHVYQIPDHLKELEYRLIVNGLWTVDPINPQIRRDPVSGLNLSVINLPDRQVRQHPLNGMPNGLDFMFNGPPGEIITVAGTFNNWDPFMYEMREGPQGVYRLTIPLPSGTYQYMFFHRGERFTDPFNPRRIYGRDGSAASEVVIP